MMPRFYREAPVQSIWEGSGNVNCLDVLRAIEHEPEVLEPVFAEIGAARGANAHLDRAADWLRTATSNRERMEPMARRIVERLALCLQASLLQRHSSRFASWPTPFVLRGWAAIGAMPLARSAPTSSSRRSSSAPGVDRQRA